MKSENLVGLPSVQWLQHSRGLSQKLRWLSLKYLTLVDSSVKDLCFLLPLQNLLNLFLLIIHNLLSDHEPFYVQNVYKIYSVEKIVLLTTIEIWHNWLILNRKELYHRSLIWRTNNTWAKCNSLFKQLICINFK